MKSFMVGIVRFIGIGNIVLGTWMFMFPHDPFPIYIYFLVGVSTLGGIFMLGEDAT